MTDPARPAAQMEHVDERGPERRYVPPGRPSAPSQVDFPPIRNGIDYLASVVQRLAEPESVEDRDLKYAVLHLQAAVEVLLKARLLREHWSLVFKDPGKATRAAYESGDFESCGTDAAVERLREIAGLSFKPKDVAELKELAKARNALQHYGLTYNALAVEARAGRVLDFLMGFLETELLPLLQGEERNRAAQDMVPVTNGVKNISSYVKQRLNRLRGDLQGLEDRTIRCPKCEKMTLVLAAFGSGESSSCYFCIASWQQDGQLMWDYLQSSDGADLTVELQCPDCDRANLAQGMIFADGDDAYFCFSCVARYKEADLIGCAGCGRPLPIQADIPGSGGPLCTACRHQLEPDDNA